MNQDSDKNNTSEQVEQVYIDIAKGMIDAELNFLPRLYKKLFTLEEANIVSELPAPFEEVGKKLNLSAEYVAKVAKKLVKEGKILQTAKGPRAFNFGSQFGDILLANPAQDATRDNEFWELFMGYLTSPERLENEKRYLTRDLQVNGQPISRVIPMWKAVKDIPGVMPCEDMREILKAYADRLNTTRCVCRTAGPLTQTPCPIKEGPGTPPEDGNCIHFGQMAEYFTEAMELTPYRSVEEIMKTLEKMDNMPHYQMGPNDRDVKFVCTCCDCCCKVAGAIKSDSRFTLSDLLSKSRFLPFVNQDACNGCESCVSMCSFQAIEMKDAKAQIDAEKCFGCGNCVVNCPVEALKMKIARPPEHIPEGGAQLVDVEILEVRPVKP